MIQKKSLKDAIQNPEIISVVGATDWCSQLVEKWTYA
jgi:hypothetical protein